MSEGVLVYCEHSGGRLSSIAAEAIGAGSRLSGELGQQLIAVVIGSEVESAAKEAVSYGAEKVYLVDNPVFKEYLTDTHLNALEKVVRELDPGIVLFGQTSIGKDIAPRLAFRLNTGVTLDCIGLEIDADTKRLLQTKPVYGGNANVVQYCESNPQIAAVRIKAMQPAERDESRNGDIIKFDVDIDHASIRTKLIDRKIEETAGIKLEDAETVIVGGRGIGGPEGFERLQDLAKVLKGAVGASRPPCDNGWVSDNMQIGLTGKIVSPSLYIAVAISGSSQHLSGCSGAKVVVAINKDADANIFKVAHYGIVADWKKALPEFTKKIKELVS
jgi:electron transfer flavoprotein alpha subunit